MSNSTTRIQKGLASVAAYDGPSNHNLSNLKNGPTSAKSLRELAELSENVAARHVKRLTLCANDMEAGRVKAQEAAEGLGLPNDNKREALVKEKSNAHRRDVLQASEEERYNALRELELLASKASATAVLFESPAHVLMQKGLGTERRGELLRQIDGSGPIQLDNYARLAVANNDQVMGAVVADAIAKLPKDQRDSMSVSRAELASELAGEEYNATQATAAVIQNRFKEALNANRRLERDGVVEATGVHRLREHLDRKAESTGDSGEESAEE